MKSALLLFLLIGLAGRLTAQVRHVILISIDGFHPDMYLDKSWPAPNLSYLAKEGTYADYLLSVFPSYTYPSHTAMVTGALPARSGILFNQPVNDHSGAWNWFARSVRVPALWQVLKAKSYSTAAIEWPATVGADITWNLPEIWSADHPGDRITEARKYATPGLAEAIEQNATGKLDSMNFNDDYLLLDENLGRATAYVFKTRKPVFMAVHFANVDSYEHDYGRDADSVRMALETDDRAIGNILEAVQESGLKDSTAVIIVGDHGFASISQVMRPNMLIKGIAAKFVPSGGSCFLYKYPGTSPGEIPGIVKAVTDSLNKLPAFKRKLFRIIDRKELYKMGADSAALLALSGINGSGLVFSGSTAPAKTVNHGVGTRIQQSPMNGIFFPTHGGHHGYDPNNPEIYTGFIAYGAGIIKGGHIDHLAEPDIAVLVAKLLGIDFKTPDGKYIPGVIAEK